MPDAAKDPLPSDAPIGLLALDARNNVVQCTPWVATLLGVAGDLCGQPWSDVPAADRLDALFPRGGLIELPRDTADSCGVQVRWIDGGEGRRTLVLEPLTEGLRHRLNLFELSHDMLAVAGTDGLFKCINAAFSSTLGYDDEELLSRPFFDFVHPDDVPATRAEMDRLLRGAATLYFENRYRCKDGSYRWLAWTAVPDTARSVIYSVARDMTSLRVAEASLGHSERRLRDVLENSTAVIYVKDLAGRYVLVNRRYTELFGLSGDRLLGHTDHEIFDPYLADAFRANDLAVIESNSAMEFEELAPHDDGVHTYVSVKFPWRAGEGEICGVCGISTDITPRKRAEEEIARRALEATLLYRSAVVCSSGLSFEHAVTQMVQVIEEHTAWQVVALMRYRAGALRSIAFGRVLSPVDDEPALAQVAGEAARSGPTVLPGSDGQRLVVTAGRRGSPDVVIVLDRAAGMAFDETVIGILHTIGEQLGGVLHRQTVERERAALQQRLNQAQRMEAMGQLASGVAHDFNNLLTVIVGNVESAVQATESGANTLPPLAGIQQAALEASDLTQALLSFSRSMPARMRDVDVVPLVRSIERVMRRMVPAPVEIDMALAVPHAVVVGDPGQLQQVLLNLAIHAREALPTGGSLRLGLDIVPRAERPGAEVVLDALYRGPAEESRGDPARPDAAGLWLSIVHSIAQAHNGVMEVRTRFGVDTRVTVRLPERPSGLPPELGTTHDFGQGQLVLVAEPNPQIRGIVSSALRGAGFEVEKVGRHDEFVAAFGRLHARLALVIIDRALPGGGLPTVDHTRERNSNVPIILTTDAAAAVPAHGDARLHLLVKPFQMDKLGMVVRDLLVVGPAGETDA